MKKKLIIAVVIIITAAVAYGLYENQKGINERVRMVHSSHCSSIIDGVVLSIEGFNYTHLRATAIKFESPFERRAFLSDMTSAYTMNFFGSRGITQIIISDGKNEWIIKL